MPTILVVDDQPCVRSLIAAELSDEGYQVVPVADAESARKGVRSLKPDLVLLDLYLEGPDGWDVLHAIKRRTPGLPVIIVTAYDSFQEDPRLSEADGYVIKSTDFTELKEAVAKALKTRGGVQARLEARRYVPETTLTQLC